MPRHITRYLSPLVDLLFPPACHICGEMLHTSESGICTQCAATLPRSGFHHRVMNPVEERVAGGGKFERATGFFLYQSDTDLSALIQDIKYRHYPILGQRLGQIAATDLKADHFFSDIDVIMPVPMHWWKETLRGYNQCHMIARGISAVIGCPISRDLKATRGHRTQTSLTAGQRQANLSGIFTLRHPARYTHSHILLLDDICTTGATLQSALQAIRQAAPTCRVTILALCAAI